MLRSSTLLLFWALANNFYQGSAQGSPIDWPTLAFTPVVTNVFESPTGIAHAGDGSGRLFIQEQKGRIWVIQTNTVLPTPFLDITNRVLSGGERGLLGLAFPPNYGSKQYFYVNYSRRTDGAGVISRFYTTGNPNAANTNSEQIIKVIPQPAAIHNGGQLAFGPDGYLYISKGDAASAGAAQNPQSLLGKVLRIDVESGITPYAIPTNNPFVGNVQYAPEIWAMGLRNPWRCSFDRQTGDFYIGDVGLESIEEINCQPVGSTGGQNYGWSMKEGSQNLTLNGAIFPIENLTPPVAEYGRDLGGCVTGGYVCRATNSARLNSIYIFGDFISGRFFGLKLDGQWKFAVLGNGPRVSSFGEDEAGQLYGVQYNPGQILMISDSGVAHAPTFSPSSGNSPSDLITLNSLTTNSIIRYTFEPRNPTESDASVSPGQQISITNGTTIRAQTFRADLVPSSVSTGTFNFVMAQPGVQVISPFLATAGQFTPALAVPTNNSIALTSETPGASIYFTTNGAMPTTNSILYTTPFSIMPTKQLRAVAFRPGFGSGASPARIISFPLAVVPTPGISPASGPITNGTQIRMGCAYGQADIYYTLDGSDPTSASDKYVAPFSIPGNTMIKARAYLSNYAASAINTITLSLPVVATPVFSPPGGPTTNGTLVTVTCATSNVDIFYTTDGTDPTTNSTLYVTPFAIPGNTQLKARAFKPEYNPSTIQSVFFPLQKVATPTFSLPAAPVTNGTLLTIQSTTLEATIRYTLDNSDPQLDSAIFSQPVPVFGPVTVKARAYRDDLDPSDLAARFFGLLDPEHSVVTTLAGGTVSGFQDGPLMVARFNTPRALCFDRAGNLYVADTGNHSIRRITPDGMVSTYAGNGSAGSQLGYRTNAQFNGPTGVCVDRLGNFYVADGGNCNRVCRIDTNGLVSILATLSDCRSLPNLSQIRSGPDANLYAAHWFGLRKITPDGNVSLFGGAGCNCPGGWGPEIGVSFDNATNIFSAAGSYIWKSTPDGISELFAGGGPGVSDGPRLQAGFSNLRDSCFDISTNLVVSDVTRILRVNGSGIIRTLAGTASSGFQNGRGSQARFFNAAGLASDTNGNIYVADSSNHCIRVVQTDTTGIGIADQWQLTYFGAAGINPSADPDHDGMSNFDEFWAGTIPTNSNSFLSITSTSISTNGLAEITWQSVSGKTYSVRCSDDLSSWDTLKSSVPGTGGPITITDPTIITDKARRYYRVFSEF